jgi:hypothetical protein
MAAMGVTLGDAVIVLTFTAAAVAMAEIGILPGDEGIALAFAVTATAAARFVGREVGVCHRWRGSKRVGS